MLMRVDEQHGKARESLEWFSRREGVKPTSTVCCVYCCSFKPVNFRVSSGSSRSFLTLHVPSLL